MTKRWEDEQRLMAVAELLGDRELKCLTRIARRLLAGQVAYGELSPGKKNWKREAMEEAMDMSVYLAALLEDEDE
jgi:hypothetical protein